MVLFDDFDSMLLSSLKNLNEKFNILMMLNKILIRLFLFDVTPSSLLNPAPVIIIIIMMFILLSK